MRYKFNILIKNESAWPKLNEDGIQIGNYAEWDEIVDESGEVVDNPVLASIADKRTKAVNDVLPESYINAGEVIEEIIETIEIEGRECISLSHLPRYEYLRKLARQNKIPVRYIERGWYTPITSESIA